MSPALRCSRCGYASAAVLPLCGYCYRRLPRRHPISTDAHLRTGPAAAEAWARNRSDGPSHQTARPQASPPPPAPERYRSLVGLGVVAQLLLAAVGLLTVVVAVAHLVLLGLTIPGDALSEALRADSAEWAQLVADTGAWLGVGGLVVTGAVFMAWGVRAYRNLPHLGIGERRWWTLWTIFGWLIPGANLFVPKLIMDDVWRASNPSLPPRPGPGWMNRPVGSVVHQWWLLWLGAPAVYVLVRAASPASATSLVERRWAEAAAVLAGLILAGAAQAARQMVAIVSLAQMQRASLLARVAATQAQAHARAARADRPMVARKVAAPAPVVGAAPAPAPEAEPVIRLSDDEVREAIASW